jgi:hypothetical protein
MAKTVDRLPKLDKTSGYEMLPNQRILEFHFSIESYSVLTMPILVQDS